MTALLLSLLLAGLAGPADAGTDAELQARAEASFDAALARRESGQDSRDTFRAAAGDYARLRDRGHRSAALETNLGKCSVLAGDLPAAILAFRRAARLAPADAEIHALLTWSRAQVPSSEALPRVASERTLPWDTRIPDSLAWAAFAVAYAAGWLLLARALATRRANWLAAAIVAFAAAAALGLQWLARSQDRADWIRRPAVVIAADGVLLRAGNGPLYPTRIDSPLPPGTEARLLGERGSWGLIELTDGPTGWVPLPSLLVDRP